MRLSGALSLVAGALLASVGASSATTSASAHATSRVSAPTGLPLYMFTKTGSANLPWVATSLRKTVRADLMAAGPLSAENGSGLDVVAFATASHHVAIVRTGSVPTSYADLTTSAGLPTAADAPVPFFDQFGRLNLAYVATGGDVTIATLDDLTPLGALGRPQQFIHRAWTVHDLTTATVSTQRPAGFLGAGQLDAVRSGSSDVLVVRTPANELVQMTMSALRPFTVTSGTVVATNVRGNPAILGALSDGVMSIASATAAGHVIIVRATAPSTWTTTDLTTLLHTTNVNYTVAGASTASALLVGTISQVTGAVQLATGVLKSGALSWTNVNLTSATANNAAPGPPLTGTLSVIAVGSTITVAGRAADWGNLFIYANTGPTHSWVVTDASAAGGVGATTIGTQVATVDPAGTVELFAGGVSSPAPTGVGIYDIPYSDLGRVISDGWPILGITGGLGTTSAPWVCTISCLNVPVTSSPDYVIGQTIQSSHKRTGWLSFWTVTGPQASETASPTVFYNHAFTAGAAIASQIDTYTANGLNLKPDWVIFDPEGFPDAHSQMDGIDVTKVVANGHIATVTTASATTLTTGTAVSLAYSGVGGLNVSNAPITVLTSRSFTFATTVKATVNYARVIVPALQHAIWQATINGWRNGLASIDPSLNAGVYVDEYEYTTENLSGQSIPIFMAIAIGGGKSFPVPIAHSSNVLGYIEFNNWCSVGDVQAQLNMLTSPPWSGQYNTVQFNSPGYCTPTTP